MHLRASLEFLSFILTFPTVVNADFVSECDGRSEERKSMAIGSDLGDYLLVLNRFPF